jgi:hypothetical protein
MKYEILIYTAIAYNKYVPFKYDYLISGSIRKKRLCMNFHNPMDYSLLSELCIEKSSIYYLKDHLVFSNQHDKYWKLSLKDFELIEKKKPLVPRYEWDDCTCYFDINKKHFEVRNLSNELLYSYKSEYPLMVKFLSKGITEYYNNERQNNWIRCIDPNGGMEKWRIDFPWKIVRLEEFENLIVLNYHAYENIREDRGYEGVTHWENPNKYSVVINAETGKEVWKLPFGYQKMDRANGILVTSMIDEFDKKTGSIINARALEVNIRTGKILTDVEVQPMDKFGYHLHFVDREAFYYLNHYGSFGKIRKVDGKIEWEFDLVDATGAKRKLSDWILLGNGQLVLQAMPNRTNGDLVCIFDPKANMELSNIKDGKISAS